MYLHVMMLAVILSVTAMASIARLSGQRSLAEISPDVHATVMDAQAAMDIAMVRLTDGSLVPADDGTLLTDQMLGDSQQASRYGAWLRDPADGQISDNIYDDLQLVAVARSERTTSARTVRLSRRRASTSALSRGVVAGNNLTISGGAQLTSLRPHRVYGNLDIINGSIYGPVELKGTLAGANYDQAPQAFDSAETVLPAGWLDAYRSQSQTIAASSLPLFATPALFESNGFESSTENWKKIGDDTAITRDGSLSRSGRYALKVSFDNEDAGGVFRAVTNIAQIRPLHHLRATFWLRPSKNARFAVKMEFTTNNFGTVETNPMATASLTADAYHMIEYDCVVPDGLDVTACKLVLLNELRDDYDVHVDDFRFVDVTFPHNCRLIERDVLTPTYHRFGAASGQPVIRIDCGGQTVALASARVAGTLLLDNPGVNSGIYHPCAVAAVEQGWPAIISSGNLWLQNSPTLTSDPTPRLLSEPNLDVNFNPDKAPDDYPGGVQDKDKDDAYACGIQGGVIAAGDCRLSGDHSIVGYLIVGNNLMILSGRCAIQPGPDLSRIPVPGFDAAPWNLSIIDRSHGSIANVYQLLGL